MYIVVGKNEEKTLFAVANIMRTEVNFAQLSSDSLIRLIREHGCVNYRLEGNALVYTQGSENNLPTWGTGGFFVLERLIKGSSKGYRILDTFRRQVLTLSDTQAINLKHDEGIVNAKVTTIAGKEVLSSLEGSFAEIELLSSKARSPRLVAPTPVLQPAPAVETPNYSLSESQERYFAMPVDDLAKEYKETSRMSYITNRAKKGVFGSKIRKALAVGLVVASLAPSLVACSPVSVDYTTPAAQTYTQVDLASKIDSATDIILRSHKTSISKGMDIIVDGEKLATVEGEFLHVFDTLTLKDIDGNLLATSGEQMDFLKTDWGIADGDGKALNQIDAKLLTLRATDYDILDASGEKVGTLKGAMLNKRSATIEDVEGNTIATIESNLINKNIELHIEDGSKVSNRSLIMMATAHIYKAAKNSGHSSGGSKSSK